MAAEASSSTPDRVNEPRTASRSPRIVHTHTHHHHYHHHYHGILEGVAEHDAEMRTLAENNMKGNKGYNETKGKGQETFKGKDVSRVNDSQLFSDADVGHGRRIPRTPSSRPDDFQ